MIRFLQTVLVLLAFGTAQTGFAQNTISAEQLAFHALINPAFMDWKNNNNVETARLTSNEIYLAALQWRKSDDAKHLARPVKKDLKKLVRLSKELTDEVRKTEDDEVIKQTLATINKVYNDIAAAVGGPTS